MIINDTAGIMSKTIADIMAFCHPLSFRLRFILNDVYVIVNI